MNYQVLARKWRPRRFSEVVGQDHVVKALIHALEHERLHHAYLFAGTRGVGKTTLARILAKALNCETRQEADPCGDCPVCREMDEGRFFDLIEVDAASRTKVEDTRELLENAQYAPARGRFKVYLIDEVHMLSGHSFNALLKTLEEPPPHIKFLLATTDPQKIPVTVLSRCLQFNLKRLLPEQVARQMELILKRENIHYEVGALRALARAADGSMRDGLSLLDQAIVHGGGQVDERGVEAMLGTVAKKPVADLLTALAREEARALLNAIATLSEQAADFAGVLEQILLMLHRIALAQMVPETADHEDDAEFIRAMARQMTPEDVQLYYQTGLIGQRDLPLAPDPRSGFEMVLLRMLAFRPVHPDDLEKETLILSPRSDYSNKAPTQTGESVAQAEQTVPDSSMEKIPLLEDWLNTVKALGIGGMTRELANHSMLKNIDEKTCTLSIDPSHAQLRSSSGEARLEKALQDYYQKPLKLVIKVEKITQETPAIQLDRQCQERQKAAELEIEQDENVRALQETFAAKILPSSVKPLD